MTVLYEARGAVHVLGINRPERRNAVDRETAAALLEGFQRFEADETARVLVVTGYGGKAFCAGADLKLLNNDAPSAEGPMGFTRVISPKPLIAAIEGWCVAGGLEIALCCDMRVAARSARLGCLERRWGVPLIDGGTQRLPRVVGLGRALDLMLTGRVVETAEALAMGLVDRVVEDGQALEAAIALGESIAAFPFSCVLADRMSLLEGIGRPLAEGLALEARRGMEVLNDARAGAERFAAGAGRHGEEQPE